MGRTEVLKQEETEIKSSKKFSWGFLLGVTSVMIILWKLQNYFVADRNQKQLLGPDDSIDLINQKLAAKTLRR